MSSDPTGDALLAIAMTVADGGDIEWSTVRGQVQPTDTAIIDALQVVSELAARRRADAIQQPFVPARWGHLTILGVAANGGHTRYVARDDALGREVILTLFGPLDGDVELTELLLRRARLRAHVSHPNLAALYGADYVHDRVGFWAEHVDGRSLAEVVASGGRFGVQRACEIVATVCDAVGAIHAAGIANGGVSADHIVETPDRLVLLASVCADRGPLMAPSCSPEADVTALGRLLYFLLTGDSSQINLSTTLVSELRQVRPDVSSPLVAVLINALSIDSHRRYPSAVELGRAIRAAASDRLGAIEWTIGVIATALVALMLLWYAFATI